MDDVDNEDGDTGSLNTTSIVLLSGMPVLPRPGLERTTPGSCRLGTALAGTAIVTPPADCTSILTESPALAGSGTGSRPPSTIGAVTFAPERKLLITALTPLGYVVGSSEM